MCRAWGPIIHTGFSLPRLTWIYRRDSLTTPGQPHTHACTLWLCQSPHPSLHKLFYQAFPGWFISVLLPDLGRPTGAPLVILCTATLCVNRAPLCPRCWSMLSGCTANLLSSSLVCLVVLDTGGPVLRPNPLGDSRLHNKWQPLHTSSVTQHKWLAGGVPSQTFILVTMPLIKGNVLVIQVLNFDR